MAGGIPLVAVNIWIKKGVAFPVAE